MSVVEVERAMRGDHDAFAALIGASANRIFSRQAAYRIRAWQRCASISSAARV